MRHFFCILLGLSLKPLPLAAETFTIMVEAGAHDRDATPLSVELPAGREWKGAPVLRPLDASDEVVAAQLTGGERPSLTWMLDRPLASGATRGYRLEWMPATEAAPSMRCEEDEAAITITSGDTTVLGYVKTPTPDAAANDPLYTRTGYLHPVRTPSGGTVTGDYPADHPHQHALFNAWTRTTFEGRPVNFWDQKDGGGRIAHVGGGEKISGPVFAQFTTRLRHEDLTAPGQPRPVLDETWVVRVYRAGEKFHLFDIETNQRCATDSPLVIEKYHYGGMAFRGTSAWFDADKKAEPPSSFLTSDGLSRLEGNHSRPHWVSLSGPLDGAKAGVAVFSHPQNFRSPQWVRLHPTKPYFVFTPMVEEGFRIAPDDAPFIGRYRYVVHDGEPDAGFLRRIWTDYAEPPTTRIESQP